METRNGPNRQRSAEASRWLRVQLWRLGVVAALVAGVCLMEQTMPEKVSALRSACATYLFAEDDLEAQLTALGEQIAEGELPEAVQAWCVAVFAPQQEEEDNTDTASSAALAPEPPNAEGDA